MAVLVVFFSMLCQISIVQRMKVKEMFSFQDNFVSSLSEFTLQCIIKTGFNDGSTLGMKRLRENKI